MDVGSPAATLDNVTVENNVAQNGDGGGVTIRGPTRVSNCVIRNNSASSFASFAGSGGGMFVFNSNLTIIGKKCVLARVRVAGKGVKKGIGGKGERVCVC